MFASAPLSGHLDWGGYLKTAAHLSRLGEDVLWISEEPIRAAVEAAGVRFQAVAAIGWRWPDAPPPAAPDPGERLRSRHRRALDVMLDEDAVALATQDLLAVTREFKPDVIVGEPTIGAAAIAAEKLGLPYAVCGYPATAHDRPVVGEAEAQALEAGRARLKRLLDRFGVPGRNWRDDLSPWPQSPGLHVVYWTRDWHADEPGILPQTQFVGGAPSVPSGPVPGWFDRIPPDTPVALVTLGSLFTDDPNFFVTAAQACVRAGAFPVIAMGRSERAPNLKEHIAPRLPRCLAVSWVDYDHLFPRLAVAVHHGGMGTTHAAVAHGVPQVVVPHAADQRLQARRAAASGVGLAIEPKDAALASLRQAVETVLRDPGFRMRARNLAASFAAAGGVPAAAHRIAALTHDSR